MQVIIEGFLSYKDQLIADPFSPKINVVGMFAVARKRSIVGHSYHGHVLIDIFCVQWAPTGPASRTSSRVSLNRSQSWSAAASTIRHAYLLLTLSSVIAAIRFVLNDAFAGVGPDERQKLLHVSVGGRLAPWTACAVQVTGVNQIGDEESQIGRYSYGFKM